MRLRISREVTAAELSRELEVSYSVVKRWRKQVFEHGAATAVTAASAVVRLRGAEQRIRELEAGAGAQDVEMEILRAARARAGRLAGSRGAPSRHTRLK